MRKYGGTVILGILAITIGLIISVQINTTQGMEGAQGGLVAVSQIRAQETELSQLRSENSQLTQELIEKEDLLRRLQEDKAKEDDSLQAILADQEKYKLAAGVVEVKGPGIIITLEDPVSDEEIGDNYSELIYRYDLILELVNRLREAGAEAISINGHRIVGTTEISLAGDNVNINGTPTAPPYTVRAIGKPDTLESAISIRFGILEQMRNFGIRTDLIRQDELIIPRYSGVIRFRYAKPVEEEAGQGAQGSAGGGSDIAVVSTDGE